MRTGILIILIAMFVVNSGFTVYAVEAQTATGEENNQPSESAAVNIGNKICPVSGDSINEETKATYEYKGKIYNFCCPACIDEFKKNPEKYIQKVEEELKGDSMDTGGHTHEGH